MRAAYTRIDVVWLLRNMLHDQPAYHMPGPDSRRPAWLDGDLLTNALRSLGRMIANAD